MTSRRKIPRPSGQVSLVDELEAEISRTGEKSTATTSQVRKSKKAERQEFFLPVTGFVWFYPEEVEVINHPAFQRLGKINQLGQANLVFRGATHKRIEHVLGAVHTVQKMITAVNFNVEKAWVKIDPDDQLPVLNEETESPALSENEQRFIRLGALLHDIGHLAAGHTLEDELGILSKHDEDDRIDLILDKRNWYGPEIEASFATKPLRKLIDDLYDKYIPGQFRKDEGLRAVFPSSQIDSLRTKLAKQITPSNIIKLLIRKPPKERSSDEIAELETLITQTPYIRYRVASNMIGNTICADLVDYIYRDWYHVGRSRIIDDRILQYMEIRSRPGAEAARKPDPRQRRTKDDEFVIFLGQGAKIRTDGVSAILGLLEWRYELAETALFHRTKLAAGSMLDRALYELFEGETEEEILKVILELSDDQLLDTAIDRARHSKKLDLTRKGVIIGLLSRLKHRRLFKPLLTFFYDDLSADDRGYVKKVYVSDGENTVAAKDRTDALKKLEQDFFFLLPPGSITMYCAAIKPKIADVMIAVNDTIERFSVYEDRTEDRYKDKKKLSGGHLMAQIDRFDHLWRIHFFIDRDVVAAISPEDRILLEEYIKNVLLSKSDPNRATAYSKSYAQVLEARYAAYGWVPKPNQQNGGLAPESDTAIAARSHPGATGIAEDSEDKYRNGARTIRSFFVKIAQEVDNSEKGADTLP